MSVLDINETIETLRIVDTPTYMTNLSTYSALFRRAKDCIGEIGIDEFNYDNILDTCHNAFENELDARVHTCKLKIYKMPRMIARSNNPSLGPHYVLLFNIGWYEHRISLAFAMKTSVPLKATNPRQTTIKKIYESYYRDRYYGIAIN